MIAQQTVTDSDARTWAMLSHLAALAIFTSVPFGNILGPMLVFLIKKDAHPFIAEQGKESLNFQISVTIVGIILILTYVVGFFSFIFQNATHNGPPTSFPWFIVAFACLFLLAVFNVNNIIVAAVQSYNGRHFRYPITIRFIR